MTLPGFVYAVVGLVLGLVAFWTFDRLRRRRVAALEASAQATAARIVEEARKEGEAIRKEVQIQAKELLIQAKAEGEAAFRKEPFVRDLVERFSATIHTDTIAPLAGTPSSSKQESP